jgi:hypothetical protein
MLQPKNPLDPQNRNGCRHQNRTRRKQDKMKLTYSSYLTFEGPLPPIPKSPQAQIVALEETIYDLIETLAGALNHDNFDGILDDYVADECHLIANRAIKRSAKRRHE